MTKTKQRKQERSNEVYRKMVVRMVRAYGRRVATTGDDADIRGLVGIVEEVQAEVDEAVRDLHYRQGFSWATIGSALGVTHQAVSQRWGKREAS